MKKLKESKRDNSLRRIRYKLTIILSLVTIICNLTKVVYADDNNENDIENYNLTNEIKIENENGLISSSNQESKKPILNSRRYVILDRKSGYSIYGKDEKKQTAMASTTKIMTRNCCARKL